MEFECRAIRQFCILIYNIVRINIKSFTMRTPFTRDNDISFYFQKKVQLTVEYYREYVPVEHYQINPLE